MVSPTQGIAKYHDSVTGAEIQLSIQDIKFQFCPNASDKEAANFLELCRYMGLNPFIKDAYLVKYGEQAASMVVGRDAFTKRADSHPQFAGIESGVIVVAGEKIDQRIGTLILPQETLVGGWCRVYRHDRKVPLETSVNLGDFNTNRANWKTMPGIMIEKCAMVKALRTAFPAVFQGMYDSAEMGIDMSVELEPRLPASESVSPVNVEQVVTNAQQKSTRIYNPADDAKLMDDIEDNINPDQIPEVAIVDDRFAEPVPYCVTHQMNFEVMTSNKTMTSKWCHQIEGGGFCVYDGDMPLPSDS